MHPNDMVRASVVFKYQLNGPSQVTDLKLPVGAQIVHAAVQNGAICIWVYQHLEPRWMKKRSFRVFGTGWEIPFKDDAIHIATLEHGEFVWHIFEVSSWPTD